ncbi:MAG: UDP-N-acetylmuramate--L-alanine ligase [Candidatus Aphodocola sp.]
MKYYCIGIKGSGMATLAEILFDLGHEVSGYDDYKEHKFTQEGLDKRGIKIYYDSTHDIPKDTIVTYSKAFSIDHPEIKRVKSLGLKIIAYNELLGKLSSEFKTIGVSGTHGKTTTSTMISHVLGETKGCNYFIGDGSGFADRKNELFTLESCEFNRHFLAYHPYYAIVTNIELEHTECYKDIDEIIKTFEEFANKAHYVIACGDDKNVRKMNLKNDVTYYGFDDCNDVVCKNVTLDENGSKFDVYIKGKLYGHFDIPLFGNHMILNALACITVCNMEGVDTEKIHSLLHTFKNAKRRFKEKKFGSVVTIDDYAHHPTEIRVTIESARQKYPNKEIVAVFLPNTYSRTKALMSDFISALKTADKAYVMDIHCDRERKEDYPGVSSDEIIKNVPNAEKISLDTVDKLLKHKNAAICFMSCTNIYELLDKYEALLLNKNN